LAQAQADTTAAITQLNAGMDSAFMHLNTSMTGLATGVHKGFAVTNQHIAKVDRRLQFVQADTRPPKALHYVLGAIAFLIAFIITVKTNFTLVQPLENGGSVVIGNPFMEHWAFGPVLVGLVAFLLTILLCWTVSNWLEKSDLLDEEIVVDPVKVEAAKDVPKLPEGKKADKKPKPEDTDGKKADKKPEPDLDPKVKGGAEAKARRGKEKPKDQDKKTGKRVSTVKVVPGPKEAAHK
jgi:hypothetical protein